jgi:L-Ala-D/L-Glu epimerase
MEDTLKIRFRTDRLKFRFPFRIAHGTRDGTDVVFVEVSDGQNVGWGEAALPPYLPYNVSSSLQWLEKVAGRVLQASSRPEKIWSELHDLFGPEMPALAAVDMAIWDLYLKKYPGSLTEHLNANDTQPLSSYTLAVCNEEEMKARLEHGKVCGYSFFKLKLDGRNDASTVATYSRLCNAPFAVDANQSWSPQGLDRGWLKELQETGCVLVEQPFAPAHDAQILALKEWLEIPVIADESCQVEEDIMRVCRYYDGVNVKLQKCGGLTPAMRMVTTLKKAKKKVLIGCMSESTTGVKAARHLTNYADWVDLDGPDLIEWSPSPF